MGILTPINIMKKMLLAVVALSVFACQDEPTVDYVVLSGTIANNNSKTANIDRRDFNHEIDLEESGTFSDTLYIEEDGFHSFQLGRKNTMMYLKKGDHINMSVDVKLFENSLTYSGDGASENNYLANKMVGKLPTNNYVQFYSQEEAEFKSAIAKLKSDNEQRLDSLENADDTFLSLARQNLVYDDYEYLNTYVQRHGYYTKKENFEPSEGFLPEALENMSYDDATAYKSSVAYKNLAIQSTLDDMFLAIEDQLPNVTAENLETMNAIKIPELKDDIVDFVGSFIVSPGNEHMESVYNFMSSQVSSEKVKTKLTEVYKKNKNLVKGKPSPEFVNYENHKGGETSLEDLKGKYVYVDVWATWCGPCIREIPSLKKVEEQFHNENIEFVSTSIDELGSRDKWFDMVNDKELGGMQLMADNAWKSDFVQAYGIDGIPRFILIDPDGNIVSADAPRPSNPKLIELLESELGIEEESKMNP